MILQVVDQRWREHLEAMDYLREGVHLRAFAQKDPLVEYRGEGHTMFEQLSDDDPRGGRVHALPRRGHDRGAALEPVAARRRLTQYEHETSAGADAIAAAGAATALAEPPVATGTPNLAPQGQVVNEHKDVGRNDPCWCGSGKKYKRCHGA